MEVNVTVVAAAILGAVAAVCVEHLLSLIIKRRGLRLKLLNTYIELSSRLPVGSSIALESKDYPVEVTSVSLTNSELKQVPNEPKADMPLIEWTYILKGKLVLGSKSCKILTILGLDMVRYYSAYSIFPNSLVVSTGLKSYTVKLPYIQSTQAAFRWFNLDGSNLRDLLKTFLEFRYTGVLDIQATLRYLVEELGINLVRPSRPPISIE